MPFDSIWNLPEKKLFTKKTKKILCSRATRLNIHLFDTGLCKLILTIQFQREELAYAINKRDFSAFETFDMKLVKKICGRKIECTEFWFIYTENQRQSEFYICCRVYRRHSTVWQFDTVSASMCTHLLRYTLIHSHQLRNHIIFGMNSMTTVRSCHFYLGLMHFSWPSSLKNHLLTKLTSASIFEKLIKH